VEMGNGAHQALEAPSGPSNSGGPFGPQLHCGTLWEQLLFAGECTPVQQKVETNARRAGGRHAGTNLESSK